MKIAIQGGQASFHHEAALQFFPDRDVEIVECNLFRQVCSALVEGRVDRGIMAIENTLVGSILPNCSLLKDFPLTVIGETYLRIRQHLMALPGQQLEDIKTVRSHPMAILQCSDFLQAHPWMVGEDAFDTADSAKEIREKKLSGIGAIAGRLAAEKYELEILAKSIESQKSNYTRFLVLSHEEESAELSSGKCTLSFSTRHKPGALVDVLAIFKDLGLNLTLIQSVPLAGRPYEYSFHTDFEWGNRTAFDECLDLLKSETSGLHIIGVYSKGELPPEQVLTTTE